MAASEELEEVGAVLEVLDVEAFRHRELWNRELGQLFSPFFKSPAAQHAKAVKWFSLDDRVGFGLRSLPGRPTPLHEAAYNPLFSAQSASGPPLFSAFL